MVAGACFNSGVNSDALKDDNNGNDVLVCSKVVNYVVKVASERFTMHFYQILQSTNHHFRHSAGFLYTVLYMWMLHGG